MADLTSKEDLQPCLLDRLTDDEPQIQLESRTQRVISLQRYRQGVLRDLEWLFNTPPALEIEKLENLPEARRSVINYGVRNLCGHTVRGLNLEGLSREILEAIRTFEPRIDRQRLSVKAVSAEERAGPGVISFEIRGDLWARPMPEQLFLRTQVDLETGDCEVQT